MSIATDDLRSWSTRNSAALLSAIVGSTDDAILSETLDGLITSWNGGARRIFGYEEEEMLGADVSVLIPEDRRDEQAFITERVRCGERVGRYDTVRRRKDGRLVAISLTAAPIRGPDDSIIGVSKIARDLTERKRLEEAQRMLSREVNHRSKNLLAVVEAIIRQTVAFSSPQEFMRRISQRLGALSANQDLLIAGSWRGAEMREVVRSQIGHVEGLLDSQVRMRGESLMVTPMAAQALGMAFHELATNALLHGALSTVGGSVDIQWQVEQGVEDPQLVITWREAGGPRVARPARHGFGTTIMERITGQSLGGDVTITYAPDGLIWELRAPATSLVRVPAPQMAADVAAGS